MIFSQKELYSQIITDPHNKKPSIKSKPNVFEKCQKLMKCLHVNDDDVSSIKIPRPDTAIIYPLSSTWIFWYRDPTKMHGKSPWEESLIKIETVRDVSHLWKSVKYIQ